MLKNLKHIAAAFEMIRANKLGYPAKMKKTKVGERTIRDVRPPFQEVNVMILSHQNHFPGLCSLTSFESIEVHA